MRLLAPFVAVAEERHFRRAAERLRMAQPALSRKIQQLERQVGAALLTRSTRQVQLTDAGRVFLDAARQLIHDADAAAALARRASEGQIGWLTVGFVDSAAFELLPPLLSLLRRTSPQLVLKLQELSTEEQLADLRRDVDVGIVRDLGEAEGLQVRPLLRERLCVAVPREHRLAGRASLRLRELAEESFVLFPRPQVPRTYDHLIGVCGEAGFLPRVRSHALQYTTMLALVAAEAGVALVPRCVDVGARHDVAIVPLLDPHAVSDLAVAWRTGPNTPATDTFLAAAAEVAAAAERRQQARTAATVSSGDVGDQQT